MKDQRVETHVKNCLVQVNANQLAQSKTICIDLQVLFLHKINVSPTTATT